MNSAESVLLILVALLVVAAMAPAGFVFLLDAFSVGSRLLDAHDARVYVN